MTIDMVLDHPSYNHTYAVAAMLYAREVAKKEGLCDEVATSYWESLQRAFNSNDYPIGREDYLTHAEGALYDWNM